MWSLSQLGYDVSLPAHTPVCAAASRAAKTSRCPPNDAATSSLEGNKLE
jgi:hypothetical protein